MYISLVSFHILKVFQFKLKYSILQTSNRMETLSSRSTLTDDNRKFRDNDYKYNRREEKWRSKTKSNLSEEEKQLRRQEMMANAVWCDKEREKSLQIYREKEKREQQINAVEIHNKDFIRYIVIYISFFQTVYTFLR